MTPPASDGGASASDSLGGEIGGVPAPVGRLVPSRAYSACLHGIRCRVPPYPRRDERKRGQEQLQHTLPRRGRVGRTASGEGFTWAQPVLTALSTSPSPGLRPESPRGRVNSLLPAHRSARRLIAYTRDQSAHAGFTQSPDSSMDISVRCPSTAEQRRMHLGPL